jgi:RimJ/RimL family protein N-acetyltransferase
MLDPTLIETERLVLRPHVIEDLDALYHLTSHPDVYRFDPGYQRSLEQTRENLIFRIGEYRRHGLGRMAVLEKPTGELVGYAGLQLCLYDVPGQSLPVVEFFYGLRRDRWGRGYITEAGQALIDRGFREFKLPKIISTADKRNQPSINVMRRVGMTLQDDALHPDTWVCGVIENPYIRA